MNLPYPRIVVAILAFVVAAAGLIFLRSRPLQVRAAEATLGSVVQVVYASGTVQPDRRTQVAAEAPGRVTVLLADEGERIRAGQVVARLDDTQARIRVREAEQRLATARARLRQASGAADPLTTAAIENQMRAARARVRGAEERLASLDDRVRVAEQNAAGMQSAIATAEARARAAASAAAAARAEISAAEDRAAAAQSEAEQTRAAASSAGDLYQRQARLYREGAVAERVAVEALSALRSAEAGVRAAQSRAAAALRAVESARSAAAAAASQAEEAESTIETARRNAAAAAAQVEQERGATGEQQRQVQALRADADALGSQLAQLRRGPLGRDVDISRTEVSSQESAVEQAREDLRRYTVVSPVSGRVTAREAELGDYVGLGEPILTVASEQKLYVRADVDEADIEIVRVGSPVRFQVDALPDRSFHGRLALIATAADAATRTYAVEIREIDDPAPLRIGMTADVNIEGETLTDAVLIPTAALVAEEDGSSVWLVRQDATVAKKQVRVRARDVKSIQVTHGLQAGDRVVLDPPESLKDGAPVKVESVTIDLREAPDGV